MGARLGRAYAISSRDHSRQMTSQLPSDVRLWDSSGRSSGPLISGFSDVPAWPPARPEAPGGLAADPRYQ